MKKIFIILIAILVVSLSSLSCEASPRTDYQITKNICKKYHKPIKMIQGYSKKITHFITHRKNKKYIIVEKVVSISSGGRSGYDNHHKYITYNKKVRKGKKVISYLIYNPYTDYHDDIIFIVDNGKVR